MDQDLGSTPDGGNVGRWVEVSAFSGGPSRICLSSHPSQRTGLWRAVDEEDRVWIVRLFGREVLGSSGWRQLERLGAVHHLGVVQLGGSLELDGKLGIVREWVEGKALDSLWGNNAKTADIEQVFRGIVQAVAAAHQAGVVHGSLKPSRIYIDSHSRQIKIVDFALGPWLPPRPMDGPWLAPERRDRFEFDERADIYALGAILYWLATGTIPQRNPIPPQDLRKDLPANLVRAILGAMEPDRDRRFPSCMILEELVGESASPPVGEQSFPIGLEDAEMLGEVSDERTAEEVIRWDAPLPKPSSKVSLPPLIPQPKESLAGLFQEDQALEQLLEEKQEKPQSNRQDTLQHQRLPRPMPPAPTQSGTSIGLVHVLMVLILGVLLGAFAATAWVLVFPTRKTAPEEKAVAETVRASTVPTIFEFAGTQPEEVVVSCPGGYAGNASVIMGRAVITDMPRVNGCAMAVRGVSVERPVAVRQGGVYHCIIDRPSLICQ